MIRSLTGTIKSPFTIVWTTRGSLRVKSFDRAITLVYVSLGRKLREMVGLLLSNLIISCKIDGVFEPFAKNNLQSILAIDLNL
jgi:hypothetical protein